MARALIRLSTAGPSSPRDCAPRRRPLDLRKRTFMPSILAPGYLANPASLISIPRLEAAHAGSRITFGCSDLAALAQTLVEIGLAMESDWIGAGRTPAALVDSVFRRFLRDHGQEIIAESFELFLTLGESIVDTSYSDSGADSNGQLFLVLNTESSFPLGIGTVIEELEGCRQGLGVAFYDTLRQALYRWIRLYDDWDARTSRWSNGRKGRKTPIPTRSPSSNWTCRSASEAAHRQSPHNPWIPFRHQLNRR